MRRTVAFVVSYRDWHDSAGGQSLAIPQEVGVPQLGGGSMEGVLKG